MGAARTATREKGLCEHHSGQERTARDGRALARGCGSARVDGLTQGWAPCRDGPHIRSGARSTAVAGSVCHWQRMRKSADDCSATADGLPRPQSRPWQRQVSALFLRQHLIERGPFNSAQLPITLSEFGPLVTEFVSLLHEAGYNRGGRATSEKRAFEWLLDARRAIEQEVNEVLLSSDIRN
jgi:hypothetical protein